MTRALCALAAATLAAGLAAAPLPATDPLLPGTRWVGTLSQRGTFGAGGVGPPAFRTVLTVTGRDGDRFVADLAEDAGDIRVTYVVKGTVTTARDGPGLVVRFRSTDARNAENTLPVLGIPYTGLLVGRQVRGTWRIPPNATGVNIEGDFELTLAK
jgi:hypothetical protein